MSPNSLFAILLRSPWWVSFVLVGVITLVAGAFLPAEYFIFGALGGFPIFVVGCIAAWRQMRAPSASRVAAVRAEVQALGWRAFADRLSAAWAHQGYAVQASARPGADLELTQAGQTTLVSARRWKAATHGLEPLRELHAAMQASGAAQGMYVVANGSLSDNARIFARGHGITVLQGDGLASWLTAQE